jgi:RNA polymerase sigma factor (sigma-70 family)
LTGPLNKLLHHFRRQIAVHEAGAQTDRDLLRHFAHARDENAFTTLVRRHGPMVLGVCRRVLRDPADADDAFQATFLVLARKAGAIGQPERLGNWLYGVATRVARKAHANAMRRRARQQSLPDVPDNHGDTKADRPELYLALDDELRRLPNKFRAPLVLCYLQGLTREEAATRLGRSAGAVKGMLERGRELLRSRLTRRGVTLSAGVLAGLLSEEDLSAAVPPGSWESAARAAVEFARGNAATAGNAAVLAQGVLHAMKMSHIKRVSSTVLVLLLLGVGAGALAYSARPAGVHSPPRQAEPLSQQEQLKRLAEARLDAAKTAYEGYWANFEIGVGREDAVHLWSRRWLQAQLELCDKQADRVAALSAYQSRLQKTDKLARDRLVLGNSPPSDRERLSDPKTGQAKHTNEQAYFEAMWDAYKNRDAGEEQVCLASLRWLLERYRIRALIKRFDLKTELNAHLERVRQVEKISVARYRAGATPVMQSQTATFFRLQAEDWLAQGEAFTEKALDPGVR